jgi:RHS repeat-associated protein
LLKRYKYVGKERDEETGLYYYGARYYAAWICRFVSVDPLQFEYPYYTPFQYAGNKPIIAIDLDGLESKSVVQDEEIGQQGFWYVRNKSGKWEKSDKVGPLSDEYRKKHNIYSYDEVIEITIGIELERLYENVNEGIARKNEIAQKVNYDLAKSRNIFGIIYELSIASDAVDSYIEYSKGNYVMAAIVIGLAAIDLGELKGSVKLLSGELDVGTYKELKKAGRVRDNITPRHIPSANHMKKRYGIKQNDGMAINIEDY